MNILYNYATTKDVHTRFSGAVYNVIDNKSFYLTALLAVGSSYTCPLKSHPSKDKANTPRLTNEHIILVASMVRVEK